MRGEEGWEVGTGQGYPVTPRAGLGSWPPEFPGFPGVKCEVQDGREEGEGDDKAGNSPACRADGLFRVRGARVRHGGKGVNRRSHLRRKPEWSRLNRISQAPAVRERKGS